MTGLQRIVAANDSFAKTEALRAARFLAKASFVANAFCKNVTACHFGPRNATTLCKTGVARHTIAKESGSAREGPCEHRASGMDARHRAPKHWAPSVGLGHWGIGAVGIGSEHWGSSGPGARTMAAAAPLAPEASVALSRFGRSFASLIPWAPSILGAWGAHPAGELVPVAGREHRARHDDDAAHHLHHARHAA